MSPAGSVAYDPYKNLDFRLFWGGRCVAGVTTVSILDRTITLHRGLIQDAEFARWCQSAPADPRDIVIRLVNEAGEVTTTFEASRCRVTRRDIMREEGSFIIGELTLDCESLKTT